MPLQNSQRKKTEVGLTSYGTHRRLSAFSRAHSLIYCIFSWLISTLTSSGDDSPVLRKVNEELLPFEALKTYKRCIRGKGVYCNVILDGLDDLQKAFVIDKVSSNNYLLEEEIRDNC